MARICTFVFLAFVTALALAGSAKSQQLPPPFGQQPQPHPGTKEAQPPCNDAYRKELGAQIESLEGMLGSGDKLLVYCQRTKEGEEKLRAALKLFGFDDEKIAAEIDESLAQLGREFGIPLSIRALKHMCVQSAGEMERHFRTEIGRMRAEQNRCKGV